MRSDRIHLVKILNRTENNNTGEIFSLLKSDSCRPMDTSHYGWKSKHQSISHASQLQNLSPHSSLLSVIHVWRRCYIFSFVGHCHQTTMPFSRSGTTWRNNSCPRSTRFFAGKYCRRKERSMRRKQTTALGCPTQEHARQGLRNSPLVRLLAPLTHLPLPTLSPTPSFYSVKVKVKRIGPFLSFYPPYYFCI